MVRDGRSADPVPFATPPGLERTVRFFAHCTAEAAGAPPGAVTLAFANPQTFGVTFGDEEGHTLPLLLSGPRDEYHLATPASAPSTTSLMSHLVSLNNASTPLVAGQDGSIDEKQLQPKRVPGGKTLLRLAPLTVGFVVLPKAEAPACL